MANRGVALGVATRTASAVLVALQGFKTAPSFLARQEIVLAHVGVPAQPYHVASGLELHAAEEIISHTERAAEDEAVAGLQAVIESLPSASTILGVVVIVKPVSLPESLADVLRSHAWLHAAEGKLYRESVISAARRCGWTVQTVDASTLATADAIVRSLGLVAGPPWRRIEKDAARAAITLLPQSSRP